jgi:hypothetical protein
VDAFNYHSDCTRRLPEIQESLKLTVSNYAQVSGKRIFINPDILTRSSTKLIEDKDRRFDIELSNEYDYIDSVQILIPAGYELESRPEDLLLQSRFGRYTVHTVVGGDKIVYYRRMEQYSGRFPGKDYGEVVRFYNQLYNSDHSKIVLVKKG